MANERTYNSWMGLALGAVGDFQPTWAAKTVSSLFLTVAIFVYWSAESRARQTHKRLTARMAEPTPTKNFRAICALLTFATLGVGVVLWPL